MAKAIGYVRQSRESQAAASPESQRRAIEQYAASQGWELVDVFSDIGRSGFDPKVQRPALEQVLELLERGGVDRVIVWKVDRLTRRGIKEALEIVERIENAGAALVSVTEPFDTSSALGQGIFALLLSLAHAESEKLSERVLGGKAVVRGRGGWMGGPVPFGFAAERVDRGNHEASRLVLDPERAPIVKSMIDDVLDGLSVRKLVHRLNEEGVAPPRGREWSHPSLLGLLRNPVLAGYLPDGRGDVLRDAEGRPEIYGDALVDPDTWLELQRRMAPKVGRRPATPSLLGGIAVCAGCGSTMGADSTAVYPSYRCNRNARGLDCPAPARVPLVKTDDYVVDALANELRSAVAGYEIRGVPEARGKLLNRLARWWTLREGSPDSRMLMAERDEIEAARARLREMYAAGDFADDPAQYRTLFESYQVRYDALSAQIGSLDRLPTPAAAAEMLFVFSLDFETRRDLIALLLKIECVKAGRPGIKFVAEDRIRLSLILDWDLLLAIAETAPKQPTAVELAAARDALAVEFLEGNQPAV